MKRLTKLVVLVAAVAIVAAACGSDDSGGDLGEVSVAVENAYLPFNFIDEASGDAIGFDYDIWAELCDVMGCTPVFVEAGWPAVIEETGQGLYDTAADGITITEDRKEVVDFSEPYMITVQKYMVRLNEDRIGTAAELEAGVKAGDYRIGTQVGTTNYETALARMGDDDSGIDAFDQFGVAVQALIAGDVDAVIIDDVAGQGYQGANAGDIRLLPDVLSSDPLGFIFPQGSELVATTNAAIVELRDNGKLEELITKWFIDFEG